MNTITNILYTKSYKYQYAKIIKFSFSEICYLDGNRRRKVNV